MNSVQLNSGYFLCFRCCYWYEPPTDMVKDEYTQVVSDMIGGQLYMFEDHCPRCSAKNPIVKMTQAIIFDDSERDVRGSFINGKDE